MNLQSGPRFADICIEPFSLGQSVISQFVHRILAKKFGAVLFWVVCGGFYCQFHLEHVIRFTSDLS